MVRNLRLQTRWILESKCGANAAEFYRVGPSDIPLLKCLGERTIKKQKRGGKRSIHFNGRTQNIELFLQMVISVNQLRLYGAVADMIEESPVGQRAVGNPVASCQLDKQEILTQLPLAEMQVNEERQ